MTNGELLLKRILAEPKDDTLRLVYADWLEENDQPERAEFIRVQVEDTKVIHDVDIDGNCPDGCRRCYLQQKERLLLRANERDWINAVCPEVHSEPSDFDKDPRQPSRQCHHKWSRGFLVQLACPAGVWVKHGNSITQRVRTLEAVEFTTMSGFPLQECPESCCEAVATFLGVEKVIPFLPTSVPREWRNSLWEGILFLFDHVVTEEVIGQP